MYTNLLQFNIQINMYILLKYEYLCPTVAENSLLISSPIVFLLFSRTTPLLAYQRQMVR